MKDAETRPLIDLNSKPKYVKYTFITANNVKPELDTISESFDDGAQTETNNTCSSIGGLVCITVAVIAWVLMSEIIQSSEKNSYNKPFFIRFMVNSGYSFLILPWICVYSFNKRLISNNMTFTHWRTPDKSRQQSRGQLTPNNVSSDNINVAPGCHNSGELVINHTPNAFHVFVSLILINCVGLFTGYIWYLSLSRTVAAINNTIFQSNCVFVLIYSYCVLGERFTSKKLFAALIAISGVALISFSSPEDTSTSSLIGIVLCIISTMLFAFWEVLFKYFGYLFFRFGYELSDTLLFQSGIGLCNIFMFWPFLMFFNYFQIESFEIPTTYNQIINAVLLPCFLDLLFTSALLCGITFCGALFMSVGLILVIPITFFADIIIFEKATTDIINIYSIIGACFIIIGFIIIQMDHNQSNKISEKEKPKE